jgi:hypothetical protein
MSVRPMIYAREGLECTAEAAIAVAVPEAAE